jgi:hypothetical protein
MTAVQFRALALKLAGTVEGAHMGHADFRVGGKIFATLGYPRAGFAVVMVTPRDQDFLVNGHPRAFAAAAGAWGTAGSTTITLRAATVRPVKAALEAAWRKRGGGTADVAAALPTRPRSKK